MSKIILGSKVVVSDPCYEIPTWCQAIVEDVLPGEYDVDVDHEDFASWGNRVTELKAIHTDYLGSKYHDIHWSKFPVMIGVDSGQAGIFDFEHYRNDELSNSYDLPLYFGDNWGSKPGDNWYQRMCSLTIDETDNGTFSHGVNSCSGFGDGGYDLFIGKDNDKVVAFQVVFITEDPDDEDDDYDDED